jgi:ATP-binding cassette subfamily A (ABC1) protein 3
VENLSAGNRRLISIGMALIGEAKLIVMDEPTANLDPMSRNRVWEALLNLKKKYSILISTQNIEEAELLGDKVCILKEGKLLAFDTPSEIKKQFSLTYRMDLFPPPFAAPTSSDVSALFDSVLAAMPSCRYL